MLHHAALEIRPSDAGADSRFWLALGFVRVPVPATLGPGYDWFERNGTQIHLMQVADPVIPGRGHAAVVVPDFDAALERLERIGIETVPGWPHWGERRVKATLPSGHLVELMAAPPDSA